MLEGFIAPKDMGVHFPRLSLLPPSRALTLVLTGYCQFCVRITFWYVT